MTTVSQQQSENENKDLVFKPTRFAAFIGDDTAIIPDTLFEGGQLRNFKTEGFLPAGLITPDGFTFSREVEREAINALGHTSPILNPVTAVPRTIAFTPYETVRKHLLKIMIGTELDAVTMDPQTGEVVIQEPEMPIDFEFPFLVLGEGGPSGNRMIQGKGYYSVKLQTTAEEVWGQEGTPARQLTLDVFAGKDSGIPVQHYFAGTAMLANHEATGFEQATTP